MKYLTLQNAKTTKGEKKGWLTAILYLAPARVADKFKNVCPWASAGCLAACLYTAGRGRMTKIQQARIDKTLAFHNDKNAFVDILMKDVRALIRKCQRENLRPAVRLNGTSDLHWEALFPMNDKEFRGVQFYDYTKGEYRARASLGVNWLKNYDLTFSKSESNYSDCRKVLEAGGRVAAVFQQNFDKLNYDKETGFPRSYAGFPVVDGDDNDLTFTKRSGVWLALRPKGDATKDKSGFVVTPEEVYDKDMYEGVRANAERLRILTDQGW